MCRDRVSEHCRYKEPLGTNPAWPGDLEVRGRREALEQSPKSFTMQRLCPCLNFLRCLESPALLHWMGHIVATQRDNHSYITDAAAACANAITCSPNTTAVSLQQTSTASLIRKNRKITCRGCQEMLVSRKNATFLVLYLGQDPLVGEP